MWKNYAIRIYLNSNLERRFNKKQTNYIHFFAIARTTDDKNHYFCSAQEHIHKN